MSLCDPTYSISLQQDVMIPMRDGVLLASDIYFPSINGRRIDEPLPCILGRTSYGKTFKSLWVDPVANYFTSRGYVVVVQDLRGRGESEGVGEYFHTANPHEGEDGYDTIEWIASQSWSNGRVGMTGSSHGGIVQTVASLTKPPHLKAIWVDVARTNIFAHEAREGGCMSLWMFAALFLHAHDVPEIRDKVDLRKIILDGWQNLGEQLQAMPFEPGKTPLKVVPNLEETLFNYYYRGEYDKFWDMEACNQEPHFDKAADIPGVFSGGWYDPFAVAITNQYHAMSIKNTTPQRLDMGPWNHGGRRSVDTYAGDVDFGPEAAFGTEGYGSQRLRWFDRWLKDIPNGAENDPPVRIFVMGGGDGEKNKNGKLNHGGKWRDEHEWPLSRTKHVNYYLHKDGSLSTDAPCSDSDSTTYTHDPENPVPTISATSALLELSQFPTGFDPFQEDPREYMQSMFIHGGAHQKEVPEVFGTSEPYGLLYDRADILSFQTNPLPYDVEMTGEVEVALWVTSTAVDTDFTVKILDIYPPNTSYPEGYHLNLADSVRRARYRNGFLKPEMMTPGEICEIRFELPPVSNLFKAGHCIRIDIASSNFPRFDVNPNTGEKMGRHKNTIKANNTIYFCRQYPSLVVLPLIRTEVSTKN